MSDNVEPVFQIDDLAERTRLLYAARESASLKLIELGFTQDEIKALLGL